MQFAVYLNQDQRGAAISMEGPRGGKRYSFREKEPRLTVEVQPETTQIAALNHHGYRLLCTAPVPWYGPLGTPMFLNCAWDRYREILAGQTYLSDLSNAGERAFVLAMLSATETPEIPWSNIKSVSTVPTPPSPYQWEIVACVG